MRLKKVMGDITMMAITWKMTACDRKLPEMEKPACLHCADQCTQEGFDEFNHDGWLQKANTSWSSLSHELMQEIVADLFEGIQSLDALATDLVQVIFASFLLPTDKSSATLRG